MKCAPALEDMEVAQLHLDISTLRTEDLPKNGHTFQTGLHLFRDTYKNPLTFLYVSCLGMCEVLLG